RSYVQQYVYLRAGSRGEELQARFDFDPEWVKSQILAAGAPLWTANRPRLLLWLVMEGPQGRYFVNRETSPESVEALRAAFGRRGVPLQFPLFDLNDAAAVSPDEVWRLDVAALRSASMRYDAEHILGGRVAGPQEGRIAGDWAYLPPNDTLHRAITAEAFESFAGSGAALVADEMAARFALAPTAAVEGGLVLWIDGVENYADYAAVMGWLQRLELVESARVERIVDDRLELRLRDAADASQLATLFALNQKLQPASERAPGVQLSYQWLSP
ncbi:MAG: DUF2066 domain-containing protein, partial [Halioglobus sp.]|nr:DUF2066 domain-containing protein [Halioglobus sp.]